ncbi:TPA: hypothetical protein ACIQN5_002699 [Bacillus cereus]
MLDFEKDCKVYKIPQKIPMNFFDRFMPSMFENYKIELCDKGIFKIYYSWIDQLKLHDKIVSREKKQVVFFYFKVLDSLFCFGDSESCISHSVKKLENNTLFKVSQVDVFNRINKYVLDKKTEPFSLVSIHYFQENSVFDKRDIQKFNVLGKDSQEVQNYLVNKDITNYLFYDEDTSNYFYIDKSSVISFDYNTNEKELLKMLEEFARFINAKS